MADRFLHMSATILNKEQYCKKLNLSFYLKGLIVFTITILIAQILNETMVLFTKDTFNMFYISRHFQSTLVILKDIYYLVPYPLVVFMYYAGFSIIGYIIYLISMFSSVKKS